MAGMAAALLLKRQGIKYDIFDANTYVGDFPARAEILLPVYTRPILNLPSFIRNRYQISFRPIYFSKKDLLPFPWCQGAGPG
jgi:cation diffusion facilitator CzcD-associated flavoprotein CzcO